MGFIKRMILVLVGESGGGGGGVGGDYLFCGLRGDGAIDTSPRFKLKVSLFTTSSFPFILPLHFLDSLEVKC